MFREEDAVNTPERPLPGWELKPSCDCDKPGCLLSTSYVARPRYDSNRFAVHTKLPVFASS